MAGSTYGTIFKISTWGESHGEAVGVVIDGCPAGIPLDEEDIQRQLDRRKPGQSRYSSPRSEADRAELLSGVFEGKTTGTPISILVRNEDHRSADYGNLKERYRPGQADYTYDQKYGIRDYRGGGRASGRETVGRVAAGAVAMKLLDELGISLQAYVSQIGPCEIDREKMNLSAAKDSALRMPDPKAEEQAEAWLEKCMREKDSVGGAVECIVDQLPAGLGEPCFEKLDANLAKALMSIGAVKAVEIGDGTKVRLLKGSEDNDCYESTEDGKAFKASNHAGGILGGISDGSRLFMRATFKPTPSIGQPMNMLGTDGACHSEEIKGRHDPIIAVRAVPVVEAMTALTLADHLLLAMSSRIDYVKKIFS